MNNRTEAEIDNPDRFQVPYVEGFAWVEIISAKNKIYSVELPDREPLFITQINNKDNKHSWISLPQGHDQIAEVIGQAINDRKVKTS